MTLCLAMFQTPCHPNALRGRDGPPAGYHHPHPQKGQPLHRWTTCEQRCTLQQMVAGLTMVVADISSKFDHATNGPVSGPSQNHPHWMKVVGQVLILVWETVRGNSRGTSILTPQIHWFFWILLTHFMNKTIIQWLCRQQVTPHGTQH